tara:strand:+ start:1444 stop:1776 length:333 start_codon:yes stop_codon:yes gene_type:complete
MSLEQYKDATRKELWEILQIQIEHMAELEEFRNHYADLISVRGYDSITSLLVADTHNKLRIKNLEKAGNEMAIIIADLRLSLKEQESELELFYEAVGNSLAPPKEQGDEI